MSASGVDKSALEIPGRDILLVSNYDQEHGRIVLSVPPDVEPRRVSVDAIEHWMIYQAHPGVGAILHVHAWMKDIVATDVNYPCGTEELAISVADLLAQEPNPNEAVIGLRNHGITVTGPEPDADPRPDRAEDPQADSDAVSRSRSCWIRSRSSRPRQMLRVSIKTAAGTTQIATRKTQSDASYEIPNAA